jgi:starch-binding outer membrane protein, SusD/RagB family
MRKSIYTYAAGALMLIATGCRKYVEIDQPGKRVLENTSDYDALLNVTFVMNTSYVYAWVASDDIEITDPILDQRFSGTTSLAYIWADNIFGGSSDPDYDRLYKHIYNCNTITDGIADSKEGTEEEKITIAARAKMFRAAAYLDLVNIYAKHYDAATAATDLGMPLLLQPVFEVSLKRTTVQAVYDQITKDLKEAATFLPDRPAVITQASKSAAYALLAREHLFMGKYAEAQAYADSALAIKSSLLNLANYANGQIVPVKLSNPETFLSRSLSSILQVYPLSNELQSLFTETDLRWRIFTIDGKNSLNFNPFTGRNFWRHRLTNEGIEAGPDVPEMMLTKAECLARAGSFAEAMTVINTLRQNRFLPADYVELTATTAEEALRIVLEERRRELMGRGLRLFDQKRLNKEAAFAKTITRTYLGETYTLEPNSPKYVLPFATKYITLNPEIEQNPR